MRLFVAVDPGKAVIDQIERSLEKLRRVSPKSKWVHASDCHITLVFLGQIDDDRVPLFASALASATKKHQPFELVFKGGGSFGAPKNPRVLWSDVQGDLAALHALQADVTAAFLPLGFVSEDRPFKAHLTLARAREHGGDKALAECAQILQKSDFGRSPVNEVILFRSDLDSKGPKYTAIERVPLSAEDVSKPSRTPRG